ncbi:MAG: ATP-binding cassette domain-containing protein [Spirochaetaceae bacterium]|nr:MAG: ATP-binding cassette domain-containing protein [Spirochaetaceae bacterium]
MTHRSAGRIAAIAAYAGGFVGFLLIWWGGSYLIGPTVLPPPRPVLAYLAEPGVMARFFAQLGRTVGRGLAGFALAWIVAVPSGFLMGRRRTAERLGFFPLLLLQSAPPIFWVTPLVLWFGTQGSVPQVVAFLVSLPLLTIHTLSAIRHIPDYEYDVFAIYAPRRLVVARELYLPHLLPALKSNVHLGFLISVKAAMLAEWFAAQDGFGQTIRVHYQFFAMREFVGWALMFLIVVGLISLGIEFLMRRFLPSTWSTLGSGGGEAERADRAEQGNEATAASSSRPASESERAHLRVRDLAFGFGPTPLFEGLSFDVSSDRPTVLYGPSGCGKTTLLRCVAGLIAPWRGSVDASGRVGLVFQDDALLAHRDALGNVLLPAMPRFDDADVDRAAGYLDLWGLSGSADKLPSQLSGGMRKRLAMARAWFLGPSVLLLDEPFVNLDREARAALWDLLFVRVAEARIATLIVTHYPDELAGRDVERLPWADFARGPAEAGR